MFKVLLSFGLLLLLLSRPAAAVNGAREAIQQWYHVIAPSMLPFMALMPLLTSDEAACVYEGLLGGLTRRIYKLPGASAPALAAGLLAGSPTGCAAARRVAVRAGMTRGQLQRLAIACCGLSPAFLISSVGSTLLGDAVRGHVLLRSQIATQLLMPIVLKPFCRDSSPITAEGKSVALPPMLTVLNVCGYMALFGAMAASIGALVGETLGRLCLLTMDINAGVRLLSATVLPLRMKLIAISALSGFGGICVCAQNLSVLGDIVHPMSFIAGRVAAGLIAAGFTALQSMEVKMNDLLNPYAISCLFVCLLAFPAIIKLEKTIN